jgi:ribosomal protein S18 acetylase RimI-like enzyme
MALMITKAKKRDSPEIRRLAASAGVFTPAEVACVNELWDDYRRHGSESGYDFVVFRDATESVLGFACFGHHPLTEATFDLYWIVVDPTARGRGIARSLLGHVEDEVLRAGGRLLVAETSSIPDYLPAQRLYQACGYARQAVVGDFYGPGDHLLLYTKSLRTEPPVAQRSGFRPTMACLGAEGADVHVKTPRGRVARRSR